ncbi:MAG: DUF3846 domain-containing protein [Bacteroidota bacterium]|nr:DUF3846 domain-containing protein [Bacteroidota bacterium]
MALLIKFEDYVTSYEQVKPKGETFSLEELQKFVGGYIEIVYLADGKLCMVVNEEGKINHLPMNPIATRLFNLFTTGAPYDYIVGNVLICESNEIE